MRVLAGTFHNLAVTLDEDVPELESEGVELARKFFSEIAPHMGAPVKDDNPWFTTGVFDREALDGVMAPGSRAQELSTLTDTLTQWALGWKPMPF